MKPGDWIATPYYSSVAEETRWRPSKVRVVHAVSVEVDLFNRLEPTAATYALGDVREIGWRWDKEYGKNWYFLD